MLTLTRAYRAGLFLLVALAPGGSSLADGIVGNDPLAVDVLVLNYDPFVPGQALRFHDFFGWNDPQTLAAQYAQDIADTSGRFIQYSIVEWRDLDEIPVKVDGFQYTPQQYVQNWSSGGGWHSPDTADYPLLLQQQSVVPLIDSGAVDEVWLFGGPYFGYWESAMAGPGAFFINGGTYPGVPSSRPFVVMGYNYERGNAEMLHNLGHRTESSMQRFFGGWNIVSPQTDWDRFTANAGQSNGTPGVGSVHYPANGLSDYDYANLTAVQATTLDWATYPNVTGATTSVSAATWGGPDYHYTYLSLWFELLPSAPGLNGTTGRVHNWWKYVFDFTSYNQDGTPACAVADVYCVAAPNSAGPGAFIGCAGSVSIAQNSFVLTASGVPALQPGLFYYGPLQMQVPFGDGFRCVAGPVHRLPALPGSAGGTATHALDFTDPPQPAAQIDAGSTWSFQLWYRDPAAGSAGFNLSDALSQTFCP